MPTLDINTGRTIEKIEYTDICVEGIYLVDDDDQAITNCKNFNIEFDNSLSRKVIQHKLSKFNGFFIMTSNSENGYAQYIVLDTASKRDVEALASQLPKEPAQLIRQGSSPLFKQLNERFRRGF